MIYQEDVIKVAHRIAGMSLGEADSLRKCMSKKRDWQDINTHRNRFVSGAMQNGVRKTSAEEIWRQIESFAGYAFCKAHSASFAIISYQTAYLKAHYPAGSWRLCYPIERILRCLRYTEEARRMGIQILPPDVHLSDERFTATSVVLDRTGNNSIRQTKGSKIHYQLPPRQAVRVGLSQVKGLSKNSIREILKNRPYTSLADFLARTKVSVAETGSLIRCGAMTGVAAGSNASVPLTQPPKAGELSPPDVIRQTEMLWQLKLHHRSPCRKPALFSQSDRLIPKLPEYSLHEKLLAELECLDITVSDHPLRLYSLHNNKLAQLRYVKPTRKISGKLVTLIGWAITYKRTRTGKNELMKFMTLEDATATFEVTLFPRVYKQFGHLLHDRGLISSVVESNRRTTWSQHSG